jgi:hypothetical protein
MVSDIEIAIRVVLLTKVLNSNFVFNSHPFPKNRKLFKIASDHLKSIFLV